MRAWGAIDIEPNWATFEETEPWAGLIDGVYLRVYAGRIAETPDGTVKPGNTHDGSEGVVKVEAYTTGLRSIREESGLYIAPQPTGRLMITAEEDGVLTLTSESAMSFLFNVRTRLFIDPETGEAYPPAPTPTATPSPYHPVPVESVRIDVVPGTNLQDALGPTETCAAVPAGTETWNIDVVVDSIPAYDAASRSGGITGFDFVLEFMPDFVEIAAVNPGGDSDTILAADGSMLQFRLIDADTEDSDVDPLPSSSGSMQVNIADLSQRFESGSGVLARITLRRPSSDLDVMWSNLTLRDVHLYDGSQTGREYAIESIEGAQITFGGACP